LCDFCVSFRLDDNAHNNNNNNNTKVVYKPARYYDEALAVPEDTTDETSTEIWNAESPSISPVARKLKPGAGPGNLEAGRRKAESGTVTLRPSRPSGNLVSGSVSGSLGDQKQNQEQNQASLSSPARRWKIGSPVPPCEVHAILRADSDGGEKWQHGGEGGKLNRNINNTEASTALN
jgi:hypothetical protein